MGQGFISSNDAARHDRVVQARARMLEAHLAARPYCWRRQPADFGLWPVYEAAADPTPGAVIEPPRRMAWCGAGYPRRKGRSVWPALA
jgi:hypothetical protein